MAEFEELLRKAREGRGPPRSDPPIQGMMMYIRFK